MTPEELEYFRNLLRAMLEEAQRKGDSTLEELTDGEAAFAIAHSEGHHGHAVLVSPDVATCGNCLADMRDPANRRYRPYR